RGVAHHSRAIVQDQRKLLAHIFLSADIPWYKSFVRNAGAEQIDRACSFHGWFYIVECRRRLRVAHMRQTDGLLGQVHRWGKQVMCKWQFSAIERSISGPLTSLPDYRPLRCSSIHLHGKGDGLPTLGGNFHPAEEA